MTVYYRSPDVIITDRLVKVRVSGGWRVWVIADLSGFGIVHAGPPPGSGMWAVGTSSILIGLLAIRLRGWALVGIVVAFGLALVLYAVERRRRRSVARSQLWATYRGVEIVVFELPEPAFRGACRALVRSVQQTRDTRE